MNGKFQVFGAIRCKLLKGKIAGVLALAVATRLSLAAPVFVDGDAAVKYVADLERHASDMKRAVVDSRSDHPRSDRTYYVAANGDDANDGLSPDRPIGSLARVGDPRV